MVLTQSSKSLCGIEDTNIASRKSAGADKRTTQVNSRRIYRSRIGAKGSEDLDDGLKVNFQREQAVNMTMGGANGFSRQSWFSLSGGVVHTS